MALSTLAEWTGSEIVSKLVDTAHAYLDERMLPADIKEELTRVKTALPNIFTVMSVSEALKFKYPNSGVNEWLNNFKEAFLAADDVLDELKYWELADKVKSQAQVSESSSSILGSVRAFLKRKFPSSNISKDTLGRMREAVKMLSMAAAGVGGFIQYASALHKNSVAGPLYEPINIFSTETASILTESEVFGRDNEKAKVIEWLKKPASHAQISAFCIVGPGGLGKTTLAQLIYQEIDGTNHYDNIIWVCVSTRFNVEDITKNILIELGERNRGGESLTLNDLQSSLKIKILSKKVLFILDDVWNDDKLCDWENLVAPLRFVQKGSKILLTTRMKSVAEMVARVLNVDQECLHLKGLEEQELSPLFNKFAFHGRNPNNHKDLQRIGKDIVKRLWGSPLAAKVIGTLLNSHMDYSYWKRILRCDSLINLEDAKEVADILKLSYFHLSTDVQQCFRFCAIFPEDYEFGKEELIQLWMASGFLGKQSCAEERPEDTGKKVFDYLLTKSFFEPHPRRESHYIMHDLVHELARNVSKGECCRVESNEETVNIPSSTLHVSVESCYIENVFHLRNLRTLVITMLKSIGKPNCLLPNDLLKRPLRVLDIKPHVTYNCYVPEEICGLVHLRYLNIGGAGMHVLPCSIWKLYHLQVLRWKSGWPIDATGLTNLVNLHHMELPFRMIENIKGVGKLIFLRELKFSVRKEKGQHIDELKVLNSLRELSIFDIENVGDSNEAKNAELSKKERLNKLSLWWTRNSNPANPEYIINNLQPSPTLRNLRIYAYRGHRSPNWMEDAPLLNLSSLRLSDCPFWKDLPLLAQMPNLRKLSLEFMLEVKELDYSFDSTGSDDHCPFPSLEELSCMDMPNWTSWAGSLSNYGFPNLRELIIWECPNLVELPALPLSLSHFEVWNVGLSSLPDIYDSSSTTTAAPSSLKSSLKKVLILSCPKLKSLDGFLQQENLDLQALKELEISSCENLVQIPTSGFDKQRNLLPANLQILELGNCSGLDVKLLESAARLSTLHELTIRNSPSISCFPSSGNVFPSLRVLNISGCDKLVEYSSTEYARGVSPGNSMASLKIEDLSIPHISLLSIEPFRSLKFVTVCDVATCSGMETLPEQWLLQNSSTLEYLTIDDASSLRSLPDTLARLTALKALNIFNCNSLEEIPNFPPLKIEWASSSDEASPGQASSNQASSDQASPDQASQDLNLYLGEESACKMRELKTENDLHCLSIKNVGHIVDPTEVKDAELSGKENLVSLSLESSPMSGAGNHEQVLDNLQPHVINLCLREDSGSNMRELKTKNDVRCLSIKNIELLVDPTEVKDAELSEKENLESLSLEWSPMSSAGNHEQILDNLQPHTNLLELVIKCYGGSRSPFWMMNSHLSSIRSLTLDNCTAWEHLPILGQMPLLETLNLFHMIEVKELVCSVGNMISGACFFPSLQRLHCCDMPKWKCWAGLENRCGFPKLTELVIEDCPNLIELPPLSLALGTFKILNLGIRALPNLYQSSGNTDPAPSILKSSLSVVEITACPNLKSLDGFLQQDNIQLQAIDEIHIMDCENLVLLPIGGFAELTSLRVLTLEDNPKLEQLNFKNNLLPVNLQTLSVGNCGELDVTLVDSSSGLSTLFQLKMQNCANICSIPSENAFQSLCNLSISGCSKLVEFSTQGQRRGTNQGSISTISMLSILDIDELSLLLIEPLRSIRSVMELIVWDCSGMEALPEEWLLQNCSTLQKLQINDASTLRSLPCAMLRLTHLETLVIDNAIMLEELPDLPASLEQKYIRGAHYL